MLFTRYAIAIRSWWGRVSLRTHERLQALETTELAEPRGCVPADAPPSAIPPHRRQVRNSLRTLREVMPGAGFLQPPGNAGESVWKRTSGTGVEVLRPHAYAATPLSRRFPEAITVSTDQK